MSGAIDFRFALASGSVRFLLFLAQVILHHCRYLFRSSRFRRRLGFSLDMLASLILFRDGLLDSGGRLGIVRTYLIDLAAGH
jgi:hypothetical protein